MGCVGSVLRAVGCAPIRGDPRQRPGASKPREGRALGTYPPKTRSEKVNSYMPKVQLPQYHSIRSRPLHLPAAAQARPCLIFTRSLRAAAHPPRGSLRANFGRQSLPGT